MARQQPPDKMNYLQTLVDLDAADLARLDAPAGDRVALSAAEKAVLLNARAEFEGIATLVAVSASIANALSVTGAPPVNLAGFATYAPGEPVMSAELRSLLARLTQGVAIPGHFEDWRRRLSLAGRMARSFTLERHGQQHRPAGPGSVDAETLCDAWSRTCVSAAILVRALPAVCDFSRGAEDEARLAALAGLLDRVADGEPACIEPDGCVVVPGWAERRRHRRVAIDESAEIVLGAHVYQARLVDASIGGLGIEGPRLLLQGDAVTVRLGDGRKLRANVAWVNGTLAGLRFMAPLEATDPLLSAGRAAAHEPLPAAAA